MRKNRILSSPVTDEVFKSDVIFRTIAEQSPNMIFINAGGRVVYANKRCEEITGYTLKEIYSPKFNHLTLTASEYKELVSKNFKAHLMGKEVPPYEYALITKNGRILKTILATKLINYKDKKAILGTITDITEKKNAEEALIESEKKYRTLFEYIQDAIGLIEVKRNKKGVIVERFIREANQAFITSSRVSSIDDIKNKTIEQVYGKKTADQSFQQVQNAMNTGMSQSVNLNLERNGILYDYQIVFIPISKDFYLSKATDITKLMEHDRKKDEFISIASHELKTPLTSLKLYAQILNKNFTNLSHYLPKMNEQIERLDYLVNELLDVSKVQTNNMLLNKEHFSIVDLIKNCNDNIIILSPQHKINFQYNADLKIFADKGRLEQVIINLLTNAIKYSPNAKKIEVSLKTTQKDIMVKIKDYGIGIKSEFLEKIFDRFFRAEENSLYGIPGFGMGLYISKEIITQHSGKIWVKSKEGKGTTFCFRLPVKI